MFLGFFSISSKLSTFFWHKCFLWHFFIIFKISMGSIVMFPFLFLILVVYVVSLFLLTSGDKELLTVLIFSEIQFLFNWLFILIFMMSIAFISTLIFILFFCLPIWSLICFHLSTILRWKHKLFIWKLFFLI